MPKRVPPLTDLDVKNAKKKSKKYKRGDGRGLFLLVTPLGSKLWRFSYRYYGKAKEISLGTYPDISLADARERRESARRDVAKGIDPGYVKKKLRAEAQVQKEKDDNTFEKVAKEWHEFKKTEWSEKHSNRLLSIMKRYIFDVVGDKPISAIETPDLVKLLQLIAQSSLETAHKSKIILLGTFRFAIRNGYIKHNPASDFCDVLPPVKHTHMAAPTEPNKVAQLVQAIDGFEGAFVEKCALQLAPLFFVRPGVLRSAEWSEFDLAAAEWNIPGYKMKTKMPHLVPLSHQAINILKELFKLTGTGKYLFPSKCSLLRCMSDNKINESLRSLGFRKDEITGHGFRAMARTMLHERLKFNPDSIEAQLAHAVPDRHGRAYNRTQHIDERVKMMQAWADYLDSIKGKK